MKGLKRFLLKESFHPSLLIGIFINPFFFIRRGLYKNVKMLAPKLSGKLLDFGCGSKPYENLFSVSQYIGLDMEKTGHNHINSKVDVFYDGKQIPFDNETFDSIFCSEVFEHVFNLDEVLIEISRVLKKNGQILITVPFAWNEHEIPYDFGRYTSFGIRDILEKNGYEIITLKKNGNFARVLFQLWALYIYTFIDTRSNKINRLLRGILITPINIVGAIVLPIFPKNDSLFFNNIVLARKK